MFKFFLRKKKYHRKALYHKKGRWRIISKFFLWLKASRARFFSASLISVLVGNAVAYYEGFFSQARFWPAVIGVLALHAGGNLLNDYYDDLSGCDGANREYTLFNGGSRLLQAGLLKPCQYKRAAIVCFGAGLACAVYLSILAANWALAGMALLGVAAGVIYSCSSINLMGKGWGEVLIWANYGPAIVIGAHLAQTGRITSLSALAGIPVGFLVMGILFLNQFPDINADRMAGKKNWVVGLGRNRKSVALFFVIVMLCYLSIVLGLIFKKFPPAVAVAFLSAPLALWVCIRTWRYHKITRLLLPAMAGNIGLHLLTGLLMAVGFVLSR